MKIQTFIKNNFWLLALDLLLFYGLLKWSFEYWQYGQIVDDRHGFVFPGFWALLLLAVLFLMFLYLSQGLLKLYAQYKNT